MKILPRPPPTPLPPPFQRLQYLPTQFSPLKILQILSRLLLTTRPNNHLIPLFPPQRPMMHNPPQRYLTLPHLPFNFSQYLQRRKVLLVPEARAVHFTLGALVVEAGAGLEGGVECGAGVARGEPSAGERVEGVEGHGVFAQAGEEFVFDCAVEGVIGALVD